MSRFRPSRAQPATPQPATPQPATPQPATPQPATPQAESLPHGSTRPVAVPISQADFDRQRRRRMLIIGGSGAFAALLILFGLYEYSQPNTAAVSLYDAQRLFEAGKYADALTTTNLALRNSRNNPDVHRLRANILQAMHEPEKALVDITRLVELRPSEPEGYLVRGQTYLDLGRYQAALADYTKLTQLEHTSLAYVRRGICYLKLKQPQNAIADFSKGIAIDQSPECFLQRGIAYASIGEHRKAVDDFSTAITENPEIPATYRARAYSEEAIGDHAAAQRDRTKAKTLETPQGRPAEL